MMQYSELTPEQRACFATVYRRLARCCVAFAGYDDPRPGWILKAREMERGETIHVRERGEA